MVPLSVTYSVTHRRLLTYALLSNAARAMKGSELERVRYTPVMGSIPQIYLPGETVAANATYTQPSNDVDIRWYPPKGTSVNNITEVNLNDGVWGFIYDRSTVPDDQYGTYNWCNMPHVRATEYQKPADEYKLKYVEVVRGPLSHHCSELMTCTDPSSPQAYSLRSKRLPHRILPMGL